MAGWMGSIFNSAPQSVGSATSRVSDSNYWASISAASLNSTKTIISSHSNRLAAASFAAVSLKAKAIGVAFSTAANATYTGCTLAAASAAASSATASAVHSSLAAFFAALANASSHQRQLLTPKLLALSSSASSTTSRVSAAIVASTRSSASSATKAAIQHLDFTSGLLLRQKSSKAVISAFMGAKLKTQHFFPLARGKATARAAANHSHSVRASSTSPEHLTSVLAPISLVPLTPIPTSAARNSSSASAVRPYRPPRYRYATGASASGVSASGSPSSSMVSKSQARATVKGHRSLTNGSQAGRRGSSADLSRPYRPPRYRYRSSAAAQH